MNVATKRSSSKTATAAPPAASKPARRSPDALEIATSQDTNSQKMAKLITMSATSSITLKSYSGAGDELETRDLVTEMQRAGDEAVAGDLGRVERMLANQLMTLDAIFNNMAQRSSRQESFKGIEVMMRLALKAQAQCRATAEALAVIKNPMPYIRQANIAGGHQQINNSIQADQHPQTQEHAHAGDSQTEPNKLLEAEHGQRLDPRAAGAAGRADQVMATVEEVHRAEGA